MCLLLQLQSVAKWCNVGLSNIAISAQYKLRSRNTYFINALHLQSLPSLVEIYYLLMKEIIPILSIRMGVNTSILKTPQY